MNIRIKNSCIYCRYYNSLLPVSDVEGEENLVGSGKCLLNPPVLLVVNNAVVQVCPTVEGDDLCSHFCMRES